MEDRNLNVFTDEDIVKMAQEGSNTAYEYLINKYKELAKNKSKIYFIAGGDNEDVVQEGMIGIFKAIRDFDDTRETSFHTFAELCITRQIINAIKRANRKKHQILNESLSLSTDKEREEDTVPLREKIAMESASDPERLMLMKELAEYFNAERKKMFSSFEKKVWNEMMDGKSYKEIAAELHRPLKSVDNAMQRVKKKMKDFLEG